MDRVHGRVRAHHAEKLKSIYRTHVERLQHTIAPTAHIFCFGHLHMPYIDHTNPDAVIVNLGSIANTQRAFSYVEITERELVLWKIVL
jgi:predicted phosphodiesterase